MSLLSDEELERLNTFALERIKQGKPADERWEHLSENPNDFYFITYGHLNFFIETYLGDYQLPAIKAMREKVWKELNILYNLTENNLHWLKFPKDTAHIESWAIRYRNTHSSQQDIELARAFFNTLGYNNDKSIVSAYTRAYEIYQQQRLNLFGNDYDLGTADTENHPGL